MCLLTATACQDTEKLDFKNMNFSNNSKIMN